MARSTWRAYDSGTNLYWPSIEMPITSLTGHPYLAHVAAACLYNGSGSGVDLYVNRAEGSALITQESAIPTAFNIGRISAYSGGATLSSFKLDTNTADLPSEVTAVEECDSVTAGSVFRRLPDFPRTNIAQSRGLAELSTEFSRWGLDPSTIWDCGYHNSETQGFVLNEGEGFAIYPASNRLNCGYGVTVLFTTADGTYGYNHFSKPYATRALFAMLNGSGSGVVVTIRHVQVYEMAEDNPAYFSTERIDGVILDGDPVTPFSLDTANTAIPSEVKVFRNATVSLQGASTGALITQPTLSRNMGTCNADGVASSLAFAGEVVRRGKRFENPIVLHEGQGVAIIKRQSSKVGDFEFKFEFGVEQVSGGGGGGDTYIFSVME